MQGGLRNEWLSVEIETKCKHCNQQLHITMDSAMQFSVAEQAAVPLVFMPHINWELFAGQTIIDSY
ncbi:MAG: hypothetical protein P4N59_02095 [Negativicutes bacterium]|nr:hypothetical protein [Negativicutes bacterium]